METPTHVAQVLRGEVDRLMQYLQTLPPDAWCRPSACALWEVRDVVGHLTGMAERFRGTVSRAVRGDVSPPAGSPPVGTSTQAGRRAFVARGAITRRESLGDQLFPKFRAQMDQYMGVLTQLGPQEWEKPAYSALRLVPLWTYPYLTLREIAIHAWDIRSRFDPATRLAVESAIVLMQGLALQIGPPWDAAFGQEARRSRPVRARWVVTGVSVECAVGLSVAELAVAILHGQIGLTTAGAVRQIGGNVVRTTGRSPYHATITGLTPEQISGLLTPTIPNPSREA